MGYGDFVCLCAFSSPNFVGPTKTVQLEITYVCVILYLNNPLNDWHVNRSIIFAIQT